MTSMQLNLQNTRMKVSLQNSMKNIYTEYEKEEKSTQYMKTASWNLTDSMKRMPDACEYNTPEESRSSVELSHSENNHRSQAPVALLSLLSVGEGCRTRRHIKWATKYYEAKFMAIMSENKIDRLRIRITFSTWRDFFPAKEESQGNKMRQRCSSQYWTDGIYVSIY